MVLKALRLSEQYQVSTGDAPALEWLAAQLKFDGKTMHAEQLAEFIHQWEATRTGSLDGAETEQQEVGAGNRLNRASLHQAAEQALADQPDRQQAALPKLLACLNPQEHRLIRNRYLRRPPLSPCQLRRSMGGMEPEQLEQLEETALAKLRDAAIALPEDFNR